MKKYMVAYKNDSGITLYCQSRFGRMELNRAQAEEVVAEVLKIHPIAYLLVISELAKYHQPPITYVPYTLV